MTNYHRGVYAPKAGEKLSDRESEILHGLLRGLANKEIAEELKITVKTVKFHAANIYRKRGVPNRYALMARNIGLQPIT